MHTSLILHHQMEKLVPGAFRLMAHLIARREGAPVGIKAIQLLAALEAGTWRLILGLCRSPGNWTRSFAA